MILGVSGDIGSFSEEAAILYSNKIEGTVKLKYLMDMEGVLSSLNNHEIDMGIFPIVNLRGGLVKMAIKAMGKYLFEYIDEQWLAVEHCLLTKQNIQISEIKKIVSHPQALAQCSCYIQKHFPNAELIEWQNTAVAARNLFENKLKNDTAVIGHKNASKQYGLEIKANNIQDENPNLTAFIIVKYRK
jgi:prephenate dehydratase